MLLLLLFRIWKELSVGSKLLIENLVADD